MIDWNKPDSTEVLCPWLLVDRLTAYQAAMLICGRAPRSGVGRPAAYSGWVEALRNAIRKGALRAYNPQDVELTDDEWDEYVEIQKEDLRAWLIQNSQQSFFFLLPASEWPIDGVAKSDSNNGAEKPLAARERNNLHRIIRALAEMQKLPRTGYAESIRKQLETMGLTVLSDDTIRKAIDTARSLDS